MRIRIGNLTHLAARNTVCALLSVASALFAGGAATAATPCPDAAGLRLPDVRIAEARHVEAAGRAWHDLGRRLGGGRAPTVRVAHCALSGTIGGDIGFELILPDRWNGRVFMGGGSAFVGRVMNSARATANLGYATVGTDTGHKAPQRSARWALGNPAAQRNFGHRAVHRTAETAKAIVRAYYGRAPDYTYFSGCSRGGGQGLMAAQRYPGDFDGIVAGAPAFDWTGLAAAMVRNSQRIYPDGDTSRPVITADNLRLLERRVLAACDARDGVRDGVMEDPRRCDFDTGSIPACRGDVAESDCFTRRQRTAIDTVYAGPGGVGATYPGLPFGGENAPGGWRRWVAGIASGGRGGAPRYVPSLHYVLGTEFFRYFVFGDAAWDFRRYDLVNWRRDTAHVSPVVDAVSPDLGRFRARGGKLIAWHGWSDAALSALRTVQYYEAAKRRDPALRDFFRFFALPGVQHCGGGPGPYDVDWVSAIVDWVERGRAPRSLTATGRNRFGHPVRSRKLCPYPERGVYRGSGSTDDAGNFRCAAP